MKARHVLKTLAGYSVAGSLTGAIGYHSVKSEQKEEIEDVRAWNQDRLASARQVSWFDQLLNRRGARNKLAHKHEFEQLTQCVSDVLREVHLENQSFLIHVQRLPQTAMMNVGVLTHQDDMLVTFYLPVGAVIQESELKAILKHEVGHHVHGDSAVMSAVTYAPVGAALFAAWREMDALNIPEKRLPLPHFCRVMGRSTVKAGLVFSVGFMMIQALSRHNEYQADAFATRHGAGPGLIDFFEQLEGSLSEDQKRTRIGTFFHTHPLSQDRIRRMRHIMETMDCEKEMHASGPCLKA